MIGGGGAAENAATDINASAPMDGADNNHKAPDDDRSVTFDDTGATGIIRAYAICE